MNIPIKEKFILDETISDQIRKTREEKGISLEKISQELKINIKYLKAIEKNELNKLPTGIYSKNFLKQYARFLNINIDTIDQVLKKEDQTTKNNETKNLFSKKIPSKHYFLSLPKIIKNTFILLIVMSFLVYLGFFINNIVSPPKLTITYPIKDITTTKNIIEIRGNTEKEVQIYINENLVLTNADGSFSQKINLKRGINHISITAQKKYSKKNIIVRKILVN